MPDQPRDTDTDTELDLERAHLAESRRQLTRMRERTAALDSATAGDWVSREVLESAFALRIKQLADDPTVPLFFGRLDQAGEVFHVGRRHVSDPGGEPMVVDWRAPVSLPFYRASTVEPMGVDVRRRYGFQQGRLTGYEDEHLTRGEGAEHSAILEAEIERPRVGPMRDIVATIQPEQDVIVRSDLSETICVQGAPGTGKTAVGLHRAAYLLFAHREQLSRQGVLVVGPNASFLRYIREVLPALGEIDATQATIEQLVLAATGVSVRGVDEPARAVLKGDARMAEVLRRAVWAHVMAPAEGLLVPRGSRRWRVATYEVEETVAALRARGVRYGAARAMLPQALAHRVLVRMEESGDSPDDRVQDAVARSKQVKAYTAAIWPVVDPKRLVWRLLSDPVALGAAAEGILDPDEQTLLLWAAPSRAVGSARWSVADAVLLDEVTDLVERTPSLAHIVVDEAQDLSAMMLRVLARRSTTGSLTVLGDLAQATTPWASRSWAEALAHLGKPGAHVEQLVRGYRVPGRVIEYAARLLPHIAPDLEPPISVRRSRGDLEVATGLADAIGPLVARPGSVAVIVADVEVPGTLRDLEAAGISGAVLGQVDGAVEVQVELVAASLAKGLEFDHVVLLDPRAIVAGEPDRLTGLRRLYVCLTRAVTSLTIVAPSGFPVELGEPPT